MLALAILVVRDPAFVRVCAYLQGDATAGYATSTLAAALFDWPLDAGVPSIRSCCAGAWPRFRPTPRSRRTRPGRRIPMSCAGS